jgi:hypothetical protein
MSSKSSTDKGDTDPFEIPDVEIDAAVKAKRLRFDSVPETEVQIHGDERSFSESERENLPEEVEPGVEYRDVEVRWRAAAHLDVQSAADRPRERPRSR